MKMPLVSVVMPVYNMEKYIESSLKSVFEQTFSDYEIVCVDDGSQDGSSAILHAIDDPRLRIVKQHNQGLSAARNTGIYHAKGKYVALLDPDDLWEKDKLSEHVKHLETSNNIGISYCPSLFITEDGNKNGLGQFPKLHNITLKTVMCRNPVGNGSAAVIRKDMLDELAPTLSKHESGRVCFFDESMRQSEDIDFWVYCAIHSSYEFEGIEAPLTLYRINASGLSANLKKQFAAWEFCMEKHLKRAPDTVKPYFNLARAYQYRYLSRRAVQSRSAKDALAYCFKAFKSDTAILREEPGRTLVTLGCALLSLLPGTLYSNVERGVLNTLQRVRTNFV
ncbi:glycosyltransferase [Alteromonas sp. D210916BOD_24]|uniref:glycosyltransferase family 2 protein n=1 Tax=Alteromonas sp. D210916BOD_24 TaxID=3157618 RepID=UPI00399CD11D